MRRSNLGIAVALGTEGLLVPVVRSAERLEIATLSEADPRSRGAGFAPAAGAGGAARTARSRSPTRASSARSWRRPVINQPQVAILDIEAIVRRPVVLSDSAGAGEHRDPPDLHPRSLLGSPRARTACSRRSSSPPCAGASSAGSRRRRGVLRPSRGYPGFVTAESRAGGVGRAGDRTMSGLEVRPLYEVADLPDAGAIGRPGEFPYTRGIYESMYRGRLWTMRQFAATGPPRGERALPLPARPRPDRALRCIRHAVADGPRLRPSPQPRRGGREGVALDTVEDM